MVLLIGYSSMCHCHMNQHNELHCQLLSFKVLFSALLTSCRGNSLILTAISKGRRRRKIVYLQQVNDVCWMPNTLKKSHYVRGKLKPFCHCVTMRKHCKTLLLANLLNIFVTWQFHSKVK